MANGRGLSQSRRFIAFGLNSAAFYLLYAWAKGSWTITDGGETLWFASALGWWALSLLSAPFYRPPRDALGAAVAALTALIALDLNSAQANSEHLQVARALAIGYAIVVGISALSAALLEKRQSSSLSRFSYLAAERLSSGAFIFGIIALISIFGFYTDNSVIFVLSAVWLLFAIVRPFELSFELWDRWIIEKKAGSAAVVGEIIGVQSRHSFIAKLLPERPRLRRYDFVEFVDETDSETSRKGFVVDNWVLNSEQWIKIVSGPDVNRSIGLQIITEGLQKGLVYKIETIDTNDILGRFVGTVFDKSNILNVRFDYGMKVTVSEGTLLEIPIGTEKVLYQITQGTTETEVLENKNEAGLIIGHASQIGTWNGDSLTFDKFGWVPEINTPIYLASPIDQVETPDGEILLGHIPDTNYPIFMDKSLAINCHMAILGVTGTGKSVFARDLIRRLSQDGMKFICIDFTGEYRTKLAALNPVEMIPQAQAQPLFDNIDAIANEMAKFQNQRDILSIAQWEQELGEGFRDALLNFLNGAENIGVFELPDVANSTSILSYTRWFFKVLFEIAKEGGHIPEQLCVVLEEAHTVIPEWNFVSSEDRGAQSLLNQIAQIALQGRKYKVGFMVIAQRTANVSKTVLTQCNTIVAFQQFDKTSGDFLANYMGNNMIEALQNLRPRQAIAVGKAFRSGLPTIFRVPDIAE
jgi:hypothetical protein